jgi:DNA-binding CsgD family transcriptional regulator
MTDDTAIRVRGLRKRCRTGTGVDLDIGYGEVVALLGPNGAGKTTTVEILAGYRHCDGGAVSVLGRDPVLAPSVASRLLRRVRQPRQEALSPREVEVLRLAARGLSNGDIGRALHIGEATVKTHLLRTFAKLGVSDRTAAVTTAMARDLL